MLTEAWSIGSLEYGAGPGAYRLYDPGAGLATTSCRGSLATSAASCRRSNPTRCARSLPAIVADSPEYTEEPCPPRRRLGRRGKGAGKTQHLDQYTVNLTENAKKGKIDPVLGRDSEIRQMVDILTRRRQNNPILTGEAGVGKTAVVEGFALRIAEGDVPPVLKNVAVRTLDLGLLQAGAGVKGEFENRLKRSDRRGQVARPRRSSCSSTKRTR